MSKQKRSADAVMGAVLAALEHNPVANCRYVFEPVCPAMLALNPKPVACYQVERFVSDQLDATHVVVIY